MAMIDKGLLLHVGLPKTGTTTLQQAIFPNHSQLYYLGKFFRTSVERGCLSNDVYEVLQPLFWGRKKAFDTKETIRLCREKILPQVPENKCLLVSYEVLGNRPTVTFRLMLERTVETFGFCRILYVLRNPVTQIPSEYLQNIEGGFIDPNRREWMDPSCFLDIETWFAKKNMTRVEGPAIDDRRPFFSSNYIQNIHASIEILGKENVGVFLFEELQKQPEKYYRSISRFIGIDPDEAYCLSQQKHLNKRITQGELDKIRQLYSSPWTRAVLPFLPKRLRRSVLSAASKNSVPAKVELNSEFQDKIIAATRDGHRWLAETLDLPLAQYGYPI